MDKLDNLFNKEREAFDEEPLEGHFHRFEEKLNHHHRRRKLTITTGTFLKIASLVIVVLLSANLFVHRPVQKPEPKEQGFVSNEMNETAHFYNTRINSGLSQLKQMSDQGLGSETDLIQLKKEMDEMDRLHQELQKEYSKNPNDERVINAMIDYYQTKLNIINTIREDLENIKSLKNKNHENIKL